MSITKKIIEVFAVSKNFKTQSFFKISEQLGISKSSLHRQKQIIEANSSSVGATFFQTAEGFAWMNRLIMAVLFIFGIKFNIGAESLASFFTIIYFEKHVGLSASSINRMENQMRDLLIEYDEKLKPILDKLAEGKDLIAGADETFFDKFMVLVFMDLPSGFLFHEKISEKRTFKIWKESTSGTIRKFKKIVCLVSDRAKALLKLSLHHGCTSVGDLFHFLMKPVRQFKFSFSRKLATLSKEEKRIASELTTAKPDSDTQVLQEKLTAIKGRKEIIKQGQASYRHELRAISTTVHPFDLNLEIQSSEQVSNKLNASVLSLREVLVACEINDNKNVLEKMGKQIESISVLVNSWWQWVDEDLESQGVSSEFKNALKHYLLPVIYFQKQSKKAKSKKALRKIYEEAYQAAEKKLMSHQLMGELTKKSWLKWAKQMCCKFQRTTSAVEGRNGLLAGFNLCARGMTEAQLESQTIINNYWNKRADGTTAVERCFNYKPEINLFEFIVKNMKDLPIPRRRWHKNISNYLQLNILAAV